MGYSSKYHAASLAAVFVALAVGILIGAALGSDVVSGTAESLEDDLAEDLDQLRAENSDLEESVEAKDRFDEQVYPAIVGGRLEDQNVALIALGNVDTAEVKDQIEGPVETSGAELTAVASVREPPDADALTEALPQPQRQQGSPDDALRAAAERAGRALVGRGDDFEAVRETLLSGFSGDADGITLVVLARERPEDLTQRESSVVGTLEDGLIRGIRNTGVRVVGAERSGDDPSSVDFFTDRDLPSVDNIDTYPGRVALILALDGADGAFGSKDSADGLLPDLVDAPPPGG